MGLFLSSIQNKCNFTLKDNDLFFNKSLQQIYEYHGLFKSICDDFAIRVQAFTEIFGSDEQFPNWQTGQSEVVNALELFAAFIIFAEDATLKDKLRFLFNIFDFNDVRSISPTDLQFMIVEICNSTYKLYRMNSKVNSSEIAELISSNLDIKSRVTITALLKFCRGTPEVKTYLKYIGRPGQEGPEVKETFPQGSSNSFQSLIDNKSSIKKKYTQQQQIGRYSELLKKMTPNENNGRQLVICKQAWVYGIRTNNIQRPFLSVNDDILYVVSSMAIVYSPALNTQKIYNEHQKEILCLCYSQVRKLVITSQKGNCPIINFWRKEDLSTVHSLQTIHEGGVHLMTLIQQQEKLVTAGLRLETSVIVYSMASFQTLQSFYLPVLLTEMVPMISLVAQNQRVNTLSVFVACSQKKVFVCDCSTREISCRQLSGFQDRSITSMSAAYINIGNPYLSAYGTETDNIPIAIIGFGSGQVSMISLKNDGQYTKDLCKLGKEVTQVSISSQGLFATSEGNLYVFRLSVFCQDEPPMKILNINDIPNFKLLSPNIRYSQLGQNRLRIMTTEGEILEIFEQFWQMSQHPCRKWLANKICKLLRLQSEVSSLCILDGKVAYVSTHSNRIASIDLDTHEVLETWSLTELVTAMDIISFEDGDVIFAIGKLSGKILLRIGSEEHPRAFDCGSKIVDIRIASDYSYLVVCTNDAHILVFSNTNKSILSQAPKKLKFQNEKPLSTNFSDDNKSFFVCTDLKNVYQFYLPDLKNKNVFKDSDRIYISHWSLTYNYNDHNHESKHLTALLGNDQKPFLLTTPNGDIKCFQNAHQIANNSFTRLKAHLGAVAKLAVTPQRKSFLSLGYEDNALIEWKITTLGLQTQQVPETAINLDSSKAGKSKNKSVSKEYSLYNGLCKRQQKDYFALFRGTTKTLINNSIEKHSPSPDSQTDKAHPKLVVEAHHVYGLNSTKTHNCYFDQSRPESILHYTSRYICSLNYKTLKQTIINSSRMKISCIAISSQGLIAAGQAATNPLIYIVSGRTLTSTHKQGVVHMAFYRSLFLYSFGITNEIYSINIHDVTKGTLVDDRLVVDRITRVLVTSSSKFVSIQQVKVWQNLHPSPTLGLGTSIQELQQSGEVCIGNRQGDLCVLRGRGMVPVQLGAHKKQINILRSISKNSKVSGVLVSGSLDQTIKVWDCNFQQLLMIQLRSFQTLNKVNSTNPLFQSSLLQINNIDTREQYIMVSLKSGQVLLFNTITDPASSTTVFLEHSSDKHHQFQHQVHIAIHHREPIMASVGDDDCLVIRDYKSKKVLYNHYFQTTPVAVRFSPHTQIMIVGFKTGELLIFTVRFEDNQVYLKQIQRFHDTNSKIIDLQFSGCCNYIAVSCQASQESSEHSTGSKVILYKSKEFENLDNHYFKLTEIDQEKVGTSPDNTLQNCVTFMTFLFDKGIRCLLLYYQRINDYSLRIGRDPNGEFRLYNIGSKTMQKQQELDIDWTLVKFPSYVNCRQVDQQGEELLMVDMATDEDNIIYGSSNGDIYIVKQSSLVMSVLQKDGMQGMCLARTYPALTSSISQMLVSPDRMYLFCVSVADQTILQYSLKEQSGNTRLYLLEDQHQEVLTRQMFYACLNTTIPSRNEITSILTDVEDKANGGVSLQKEMILGRRAYDRRNNLFCDDKGSLVYHVGTNIVLQETTDPPKQKYTQAALNQTQSTHPISCITMSSDRTLLAACTEQRNSSLFVWSVGPKICLSRFSIQCSMVYHMAFSDNGEMLAVYGVSRKYMGVVSVINWRDQKTLSKCSFMHESYWKVKGLAFKAGSDTSFVTCGANHLALWKYQSEHLQFESFDIAEVGSTFMVVVDTLQCTITGSQGGDLSIWKDLAPIYCAKVHQCSIQTIMYLGNSQIATGSIDGLILIFRVQKKSFVLLQTFSLIEMFPHPSVQALLPPSTYAVKYNIQSLARDDKLLYVGTRCGSIYSFSIQTPFKKLVSLCRDNEKPASSCFDQEKNRFFYISNCGFLEVWQLSPLQLTATYQFHKRVKKIISCHLGILVVFEKGVELFQIDVPTPGFVAQYKIELQGNVVDAILNNVGKNLIVAVSDKEKTEIIVYRLEECSVQLKSLTLNIQLEYLDISLDDQYLLFKDRFQDIGIIQIKQFRRINTIFLEFSIQWRSSGIRLNQDALYIHSCYNKQNTITNILYLTDNHVLVADEIGTLRIFEYPAQAKRLGHLHTACYTDHLNGINSLEISPSRKWVISTSLADRSLILWRVNNSPV